MVLVFVVDDHIENIRQMDCRDLKDPAVIKFHALLAAQGLIFQNIAAEGPVILHKIRAAHFSKEKETAMVVAVNLIGHLETVGIFLQLCLVKRPQNFFSANQKFIRHIRPVRTADIVS